MGGPTGGSADKMNVKISSYNNLDQKFHLPASFQVTLTSQARPSSSSQNSFNVNTPSAHTQQTPRGRSRIQSSLERVWGTQLCARWRWGEPQTTVKQGTDEGEPDRRPVPTQTGLGRPTLDPGSEHCPHTAGAAPPPDPESSSQARPLHSQAPRDNSEVPALGNTNPKGPLGADTHLAEPHQGRGLPSQTTATTGSGGSQRAIPRGIPSRLIPQVLLNIRSLLRPSAPSFPNPAGAPELAGMRAPGTNTRSPLTQLRSYPSSLPASRSLPLT